ncbi:hypothetical protein D4R52_02900 [bacterium]|nr:MAG: hypothetical protein D4R52_02900 [bacterium]
MNEPITVFIWDLLVKNFPIYCEKVTGFWLTEPLNALTNLAFLIGAYYLYKFIRINRVKSHLSIFLVGLMVAVGLGSLSWHVHRSEVTLLLDRLPIYIFFSFVIYFAIQTLTKNKIFTIAVSALLAIIYYVFFTYIPGINVFYGLLRFVFAFIILATLNFLIKREYGSEYNLIIPLTIFAAALIFRTLDLFVCPLFPLGTHFLWHIFIAVGMYMGSILVLRLNTKMSNET